MNLIVDIGNTHVKLGLFKQNELVDSYVLSRIKEVDLIQKLKEHNVKQALVSRVGHENEKLNTILSQVDSIMHMDHKTPIPVTNSYETPETLGVDRIAAVIGGQELYPNRNILSIDTGTCITYDMITANGEYLGGAISPGIPMRLKAMNHFTAKLPYIPFTLQNPDLIGKTTEGSLLSGAINGTKAEIRSTIEQYNLEFNDIIILLTGGYGHFFLELPVENQIFADPNLVLKGLNRILRYNATK